MEIIYKKYNSDREDNIDYSLSLPNIFSLKTILDNEIRSIVKLTIDCRVNKTDFFLYMKMFHVLQDMIDNKNLDETNFSKLIIQNNYSYYPQLIVIKNYNLYKKDEYTKVKSLLNNNNYRLYYKNLQEIVFNYEKNTTIDQLISTVSFETPVKTYIDTDTYILKEYTPQEREEVWTNHINSLPNINEQIHHPLRVVRILFISYDINEPQKWECGKRALDLIKYLENNFIDPYQQVKLHIRAIAYQIPPYEFNKLFENQYPPNIIISQQFAIEKGMYYSNLLKIPHFI